MVNYVIITVLCVWHTVSLSAQPFLQFLIQFSIYKYPLCFHCIFLLLTQETYLFCQIWICFCMKSTIALYCTFCNKRPVVCINAVDFSGWCSKEVMLLLTFSVNACTVYASHFPLDAINNYVKQSRSKTQSNSQWRPTRNLLWCPS